MVLVVGFSGSPMLAFGALRLSMFWGICGVREHPKPLYSPGFAPGVMERVRGCCARVMPYGLQCQSRALTTETLSPGGRDPQPHLQPGPVRDVPAQGVQPGPAELPSDFPTGSEKAHSAQAQTKAFCASSLCASLSPPRSPSIASTETAPEF